MPRGSNFIILFINASRQYGETALDEARDGQRRQPAEGHSAVEAAPAAAAAAAAGAAAGVVRDDPTLRGADKIGGGGGGVRRGICRTLRVADTDNQHPALPPPPHPLRG